MKRTVAFLIAILLIAGNAIPVMAQDDTPFKFTCVSDIHLDELLIQGLHTNRNQFKDLLSYSYSKGYSDLFICNGDVSSYGNVDVWYEAKDYITDAGFTKLLWTLGNHAYGTTFVNNDADSDFKEFVGKESIYYHEIVNGYHFLCMAAEKSDIYMLNKNNNVYGEEQIQWLKDEIEIAASDSYGKPIFVLSHYPMGRNGVEAAIKPILTQYENVFFIWGHEHGTDWTSYTLSDYISTDEGFVNAKDGAVEYGYSNLADTMLVDVYKDRVVITYDRTDGNQMNPNSVTVWLTSFNVTNEDDALYWYVPEYENKRFLFCSYDENGKMTESKFVTPTPKIREHLDITQTSGTTKVFLLDDNLIPIGEVSEFSNVTIQ